MKRTRNRYFSQKEHDEMLLNCFILLESNNHRATKEAVIIYRQLYPTVTTDSSVLIAAREHKKEYFA